MISEKEFCEHIEEDDFPIRYGNPVCIHTNDGQLLVCMTYKLYYALHHRDECSSEDYTEDISEGPCDDYWEATAANAIRPLYQLIAMAKLRPDGVWDGD